MHSTLRFLMAATMPAPASPAFQSAWDAEKASYAAALRRCKDLGCVRSLEDAMVRQGRERGTFLGNILVQMYGKFHAIDRARGAFDRIRWKNVFSWTIVMAAYVANRGYREAIELSCFMAQSGIEPDKVLFLSVLRACSQLQDLNQGRELHSRVKATGFDADVTIANALIHMYGACGSVDEAEATFWAIPWRDTVSWNSMLDVYVELGRASQALDLYRLMLGNAGKGDDVYPSEATFVSVLGACTLLADLETGKRVHLEAGSTGSSLVLSTALLNMYCRCDCLELAESVFNEMSCEKDVVCWTSMLTAYAQLGHPMAAFITVARMEQEGHSPSLASFVSLVDACCGLDDRDRVERILTRVIELGLDQDAILGTGVLNLYAKLGRLADARQLFEDKLRLSYDEVAWNSMIMVYTQQGRGEDALSLYLEMNLEGLWPTDVTFVCILAACSYLGCVASGLDHFASMVNDFDVQPVGQHYGCLVDLLGRSGRLEEVERLAEGMATVYPDAWKSLLASCGLHGDSERGARVAYKVSEVEPGRSHVYVMVANMCTTSRASAWSRVPGHTS